MPVQDPSTASFALVSPRSAKIQGKIGGILQAQGLFSKTFNSHKYNTDMEEHLYYKISTES